LRTKVQGQARYSGSRKEETVRSRLERISDLTRLSNDLYRECNKQLRRRCRKEWVFLIEDFDKESVAEQVVDQLFVRYAKLWSDLDTHLVHEYNDSYWYGLPPMIVDILIQQGRLPAGSRGGFEPTSP
jgi:hypothetical protein